MGHDARSDGRPDDGRPEGETDMTADNIAPEDVPTHDPANTELGADGNPAGEHHEEDEG